MIIIAKTVKNIDILVKKSEYFLNEAIECKYEYPSLSQAHFETYECLRNAIDTLHSQVVEFIKVQQSKREIDEEILKVMKSIWSFEHSQYIEKIECLNNKENIYNNM